MDDYFDGCFSQEMIESQVCLPYLLFLTVQFSLLTLVISSIIQVDQLVFEELMRERFPKLGLYIV